MEKIAVLELNPNFVKMQQVEVEKNKSYTVYNEISTPINLMKNFEPDCFIKSSAIKDLLDILKIYKAILDKEEITETICFASNVLEKAKNSEGLLNEIINASTFKFEILAPEKEIFYSYTAVINSFNKPKGLVINIGDYNTEMVLYNRRNIISTKIIPYGRINLLEKFMNEDVAVRAEKMQEFISSLLVDCPWDLQTLEEEWEVVGTGSLFRNLGILSRRARKYPVEIEHNYVMNYDDAKKVFEAVKNMEPSRSSKIKGLTNTESMYLSSGLCIVNAIFEKCPIKEFAISRTDREDGMLFHYALPLTIEKPLTDALGYSLQVSNDYYDKPSNSNHIYQLALTLFKLFKVVHKLNRTYVRVLRIASYLIDCGNRTGIKDRVRAAFGILEHTTLYGVSHSEIMLACFVSKLRDSDNFNMAEWVRYKEVIGDIDIEVVRRLAVIVKIAEALDISKFQVVKDVDCDILGDSFILKLVTEGNPTLEIKHALSAVADFKKAYGKGLEFM